MPQRHVVNRPRLFHKPCGGLKQSRMHGHWVEILIESTYVLVAVSQLAVIFGFASTASHTYFDWACWVFAMSSFLVAVLGIYTYVEIWRSYSDAPDDGHSVAGVGLFHREMLGNTIFVIAQIFFGVGCLLFIPDLGGDAYKHDKQGAALFCIGSCGFVVATFFNIVDMTEPPPNYPWIATKLHVYSLGLAQIGSAAFSAGSFMYFPELADGTCTVSTTWNPVDVGTVLYIIGCAIFLISALMSWAQTYYMMGRDMEGAKEVDGGCTVPNATVADVLKGPTESTLQNRECC